MRSSIPDRPARPPFFQLQAVGVLLFLFIPVVLFLFVAHPEPVGWSLVAGVALMLGHRFLARPYMRRALLYKCLWCNRLLRSGEPTEELRLETAGGLLVARCCAGHRKPAARFFGFVDRWRWLLRVGIFVPLLLLLGALVAMALGRGVLLDAATALFRLTVGLTVNLAALGPLVGRRVVVAPAEGSAEGVAVPFPVHNFFLLGVRALLWIFRLIGLWWIVLGVRYFL